MDDIPTHEQPVSNMKSSSSLRLPHISNIIPGQRHISDPEKPIHGVKDFPKLQAPYMAALTSSEEANAIRTGRYVFSSYYQINDRINAGP